MSRRSEIPAYIAAAHELADLAGSAILPHFRRRIRVDNKAMAGGFDPVTAADRAAERAISKALASRWPDHGLEGEEYGHRNPDARMRWIIDPIDGTRAFILGLPIWGTLIGLMDGGSPVIGLMDQPYTRERFWSGEKASYFRGADGKERRIRTRSCASLADAMLTSTDPGLFTSAGDQAGFAAVKSRTRVVRYGGDCYAYCLLAAGFIDIVVETGLKPYDVVALIPIVERAGGRVTTWDGGPAAGGGRIIAAGDARVHEEAMALLA
ncbi:MAG: histidinol-phosphatase [Hyphomicrobiaceae bacterium]|nr:histidinol-phosphatase [Hyphomicrobiaceae bacterium]